MEKKSKRGVITREHEVEAAKLRAIWEREKLRLKKEAHGTQEAFGLAFDIGNQAAVGFFLAGKTALSVKAASGFARGLNCMVSDFSPRLAKLMREGDASSPAGAEPGSLGRLDAALVELGSALAALPKDKREAVAINLSGWARDGGAAHWRDVIATLLASDAGKQKVA